MERSDVLAELAYVLAIIYYSIGIGLFMKKAYPYIKAVPWRKIEFKIVGGLRFMGIITGMV